MIPRTADEHRLPQNLCASTANRKHIAKKTFKVSSDGSGGGALSCFVALCALDHSELRYRWQFWLTVTAPLQDQDLVGKIYLCASNSCNCRRQSLDH